MTVLQDNSVSLSHYTPGSRKTIGGRPLKYSNLVKKALLQVDQRLPEIFNALIAKAIEGDREAQIYLIDRRLGKPKQSVEVTDESDIGAMVILGLYRIMKAQPVISIEAESVKLLGEADTSEYEPE